MDILAPRNDGDVLYSQKPLPIHQELLV